ncbi:MAG: type II toxin-antitoxin system RelE/ParE family toxin [Bacteroidota bacterium]
MAEYTIFWTPHSLSCLNQIEKYLTEETKSLSLAKKYVSKIITSVNHLSEFPESGKEEKLLKKFKKNSRYILVGSYKIIYRTEAKNVYITDVFHTKQHPIKIARRNKK